MLAYSNPRNPLFFSSFEHLASSVTPRRVLCVVSRWNCMNLVMNLESRSTWGALGLCCRGMSNGKGGFVARSSVRGGDWDLEGQILEFMKKSKKPAAFPSKKELIEAGRMDLVMGIEREGGWLASGWDLEDEDVGCGGDVVKDWEAIVGRHCDCGAPENRPDTALGNGSMEENGSKSSPAVSSSAETPDKATGIEGILSRLEKERATAFGATIKEQEMLDHTLSDYGENNQGAMSFGSPSNTTVAGHDRRSDRGTNNYQATSSQEMWKTWRKQRAGISDMEFEASDVPFDMKSDVKIDNVLEEKSFPTREDRGKTVDRRIDSSGDHYSPEFIRTRLRNLELELSATLQSLKSKRDESTILRANKDLSEEMQNLSDALEFQQTEILRAKDALRSIRAKLAVLEGKTAMEIIDTRKKVEVRQKKIDQARHTLQLLRTTYVTWPNSASEVLLAGSFDGWTTQRKMDKSTTGIHSVCLKLYPGSYEIKFIVDGIWRIDPLRPITLNNGFENNLLTVN